MSWYLGKDGSQKWIPRDESVYTVLLPAENLEVEELTYLQVRSQKAAYQEHLIDEEVGSTGRQSKKSRAKQQGRQRGFIVRIEQEEQCKVVPCFKTAATRLLESGIVSRVDADEAQNSKSKKKKNSTSERMMSLLGVNECRVETARRIFHFAHGPGFRVDVAEGATQQGIHFFTNKAELTVNEWHAALVSALDDCGYHVMQARRTKAEADKGDGEGKGDVENEERGQPKKDKAQQDDDAWLQAVMCGEMVISDAENEGDEEEEDFTHVDTPPKQRARAQLANSAASSSASCAAPTRAAPSSAACAASTRAAPPARQPDAAPVPEWRQQAMQQKAEREAPTRRGPAAPVRPQRVQQGSQQAAQGRRPQAATAPERRQQPLQQISQAQVPEWRQPPMQPQLRRPVGSQPNGGARSAAGSSTSTGGQNAGAWILRQVQGGSAVSNSPQNANWRPQLRHSSAVVDTMQTQQEEEPECWEELLPEEVVTAPVADVAPAPARAPATPAPVAHAPAIAAPVAYAPAAPAADVYARADAAPLAVASARAAYPEDTYPEDDGHSTWHVGRWEQQNAGWWEQQNAGWWEQQSWWQQPSQAPAVRKWRRARRAPQ